MVRYRPCNSEFSQKDQSSSKFPALQIRQEYRESRSRSNGADSETGQDHGLGQPRSSVGDRQHGGHLRFINSQVG